MPGPCKLIQQFPDIRLFTSMPVICFFLVLFVAVPLKGDQLTDILQEVLDTNPELNVERSNIKASEHRVSEARAGWLPKIEANGSLGRNYIDSTFAFGSSNGGSSQPIQLTPAEQALVPSLQPQLNRVLGASNTGSSRQKETVTARSYSVTVTQPVFKGGQLIADLRKSKAESSSALAAFDDRKQKLLLDTINVFGDLYVAQETLLIRKHNEKRLETQLEAERLRKEVGTITQADVLQAQARYQAAFADRLAAESAIQNLKQDFKRFVGRHPGHIKRLQKIGVLPHSLEKALEKAAQYKPQIKNLRYRRDALKYEERKIFGEQGPEFNVRGEFSQSFNVTSAGSRNTSLGVFAELRIPLFEPGVTSRSRAAHEDLKAQDYRIDNELRLTHQNVTKAWEDYQTAMIQVKAREAEKTAFASALKQIEEEQKYGLRTTINVLDAKQEDLDARIKLVTAEKDVFTAHYRILFETGSLEPKILGLSSK